MNNRPKIRLGQVCLKIGSGATPKGGKESYVSKGIALIRSQNVYNNFFNKTGLAYLTDNQAQQLKNVEVKPEDILLNITGDSVARVCQVPSKVIPARVNQHVSIIRPDQEVLNSRYLKYFLVSPEMQSYMITLASSGATRNALTKRMIEDFQIPAPHIHEQRAIAHILGTLDDKVELNRRMNETLEAMAQALFKSWFVDFDPVRAKMEGRPTGLPKEIEDLFPDSFEDSELGEIPRGWRVGELGDLVAQRVNRVIPSPEVRSLPYVPIECITAKSIFLSQSLPGSEANSSLTKFEKGDILFGAMRPYFHKVCLAPFDGITRTTAFVLFSKKKEDQIFSLFSLFQEETIEFATNHSEGSTIPYAKWTDSLEKKEIVIPSSILRNTFQLTVSYLIEKGLVNIKEFRSLSEIRDDLLPKLLSGEMGSMENTLENIQVENRT